VTTTFVALLRGVNVGGNLLRMERLRVVCVELGLGDVRTYVQSGNAVFSAGGSARHWAETLERRLAGESRLPVSVMVRTVAEMSRVLAANPFLAEDGIDRAKLAVAFLDRAPSKVALNALDALSGGPDRFRHQGSEIYLHCPSGFARTRLTNNAFEKALSVRATSRNWNTVERLAAMANEVSRDAAIRAAGRPGSGQQESTQRSGSRPGTRSPARQGPRRSQGRPPAPRR
jgi:uncharacterized protein (DUF1697 family)